MSAIAADTGLRSPQRAPLRAVRLGVFDPVVTRRADGTIDLRNTQPLPPDAGKITARLEHWAQAAPERIFLAQRDAEDRWRTLTYRQTLADARRIAQSLLARDLSPDRPIVILSGNDIEQALLALAAMTIGVPYAPISPAYSLMSSDFGKLRYILDLLTPGLVFASDGKAFARALALVPDDIERVVARNSDALSESRAPTTPFADLLTQEPGAAVDRAHAAVCPDTIAKFLFTSGSTGHPKAVINTQRMICANQAMLNSGMPFLADAPPTVIDWLPWSHTFGSNHNFNMVLNNGGSFYIDDGNPTPPGVPKTIRNLREISPTIYFNVPKGFEALVPHLRADKQLRETFFRQLKVLFYAGAGLNQQVWDDLSTLAAETTGERIIFISSLGSTETSPAALLCTFDTGSPGNIGLPFPGVDLKLVPSDGKLEARLRGPHITPGYWHQPDLTRAAFDDEGYYKLGDAVKFVDPDEPRRGLLFDGRLAEDFKLATGTWVSVGPLRGRFIDHCAPYVRDVVLADLNRDELTALIFPDIDACRRLCAGGADDVAADAPPATILGHPRVRGQFLDLLTRLAASSTGSSTRICRAILLETPPSLDVGEATDKGSINQRAVLRNRADLVDELYRQPLSPRVISIAT
jgi:feruloyl-CoA synthase